MKKLLLTTLICTLCSPTAFAQSEPDGPFFAGRWQLRIQDEAGGAATARLDLVDGFEGTWIDTGATRLGGLAKADVCKSTKFPVTVQVSVSKALEFTVWGSSVSPKCPDVAVKLQKLDDKVLEGKSTRGQTIKMTRR